MFFKTSEKVSGIRLCSGADITALKENLITLVDLPPSKKKKRGGLISTLLGSIDEEPKSAITQDKVTLILRKIANIPNDKPINIFLHTMGGSALACELLVRALLNHPGKIRVFIPQYAFSAGTMIALAADEIYMTKNAVLGPVDTQALGFPVNSVMDSLNDNEGKKGFIPSFMRSFVTKVKEDYDRTLEKVLKARFGDEYDESLMDHFNEEHHHGYPIDVKELRGIGIEINEIKVKWRNLKVITECDLILSVPPAPAAPAPAVPAPAKEENEIKAVPDGVVAEYLEDSESDTLPTNDLALAPPKKEEEEFVNINLYQAEAEPLDQSQE